MSATSLPISALPAIRERIDGAERTLKADIARIKKLLADLATTPPPSMTELTLQKARDTLERLAVDARQLTRWQTDAKTDAERIGVGRLLAIIPEIRPLMQRQIALATERAVVAIVTSGETIATGFRNG
jgi:hypothetical protein